MDTFKEREIFLTSGAWEKLDANTDLAVWKQENYFAPGFQNFKIILPRLACMEAILTSFHGRQCVCWSQQKNFPCMSGKTAIYFLWNEKTLEYRLSFYKLPTYNLCLLLKNALINICIALC